MYKEKYKKEKDYNILPDAEIRNDQPSHYLENQDETKDLNSFKFPSLPSFNLSRKEQSQSLFPDMRKNVGELLSRMDGKDYSHAFDDIDDATIEKNISVAKNTVDRNLTNRRYSEEYLEKHPHMQDAMTMFYAAADLKKYKLADKVRRAAYYEEKEDSKVLQQSLKKDQKFNKAVEFFDKILDPFNIFGKKNDDNADYTKNATGNIRYIVDNNVNFRSQPGTGNKSLASLSFGTPVKYTGNKTDDYINGYRWAEVEYDGKTGWIADSFLGIDDPIAAQKEKEEAERKKQESIRFVGEDGTKMYSRASINSNELLSLNRGDSVEFTGKKKERNDHVWAEVTYNGETGWVQADGLRTTDPLSYEKTQALLADHQELRDRFASVTGKSSIVGDYDYGGSLECVDLSKWFVDQFTTLNSGTGHGKDHVNGVIDNNKEKGLQATNIPCAPAVYSVAAGKPGPGLKNNSHSEYGHTGIIIDVKRKYYSADPYKDAYVITYFHAWNGCSGYSSINTKTYYPSEDVTYLDLSKYMK